MPQGAALCGDRGGQIQRGPRKTCFAGKTNPIPATIQKQLVQSDGLFLRFPVRKQGLAPLTQGRQRGGRSAPLSQADERLPAQFPCPRPKRRGVTGGTWFRPSDRARPALRCRNGVSAETPAIRREPLCAATEAVKGAPAKPVLRGRQIPSPQPDRVDVTDFSYIHFFA